MMIVTGVLAVALGLGRVHPGLGAAAILAALGVPLLTTRGEDGKRVARGDFRRAVFGYVAGVVAPILCLIFDPVVFTEPGMSGSRHGYRTGCYTFMAVEMATMTAWLWAREALRPWASMVAGAFWAGAIYAWGLGLLILPLSVIGLIIGIGVFGFTPFFTGIAFFVQARLATEDARPSPGRAALPARVAVWMGFLGASLAIGSAVLGQWLIPG
jgi:hypothetical protein